MENNPATPKNQDNPARIVAATEASAASLAAIETTLRGILNAACDIKAAVELLVETASAPARGGQGETLARRFRAIYDRCPPGKVFTRGDVLEKIIGDGKPCPTGTDPRLVSNILSAMSEAGLLGKFGLRASTSYIRAGHIGDGEIDRLCQTAARIYNENKRGT